MKIFCTNMCKKIKSTKEHKHHFPAEIRVTSDEDSWKVLFLSSLKAASSLQWLPNASKPLQAFDERWP